MNRIRFQVQFVRRLKQYELKSNFKNRNDKSKGKGHERIEIRDQGSHLRNGCE